MEKKAKRLLQKERHIKRQMKIVKNVSIFPAESLQPHRLHKSHALNCGKPTCVWCMNPRKAFGKKTMQERKFEAVGIEDSLR